MAYSGYNGWSGMVREARNGVFFAAIKVGQLDDHQETCIGCGTTKDVAPIALHSEEYGPLPSDYIESCVPVCFRCHFMIHARHKIPNRWLRYLNSIAKGDLPKPLKGGWIRGNQLLSQGDLTETFSWVETPTGYLSNLPLTPPVGPLKVATIKIQGVETPDPRLYKVDPVTHALCERKYSEGVANSQMELADFLNQYPQQ